MGQSLALRTCFSSLDAAACVCNVMVDFCFFSLIIYDFPFFFFFIELVFYSVCFLVVQPYWRWDCVNNINSEL